MAPNLTAALLGLAAIGPIAFVADGPPPQQYRDGKSILSDVPGGRAAKRARNKRERQARRRNRNRL